LKYRNDVKYFIKNKQLIPISEFDISIFKTGESVYEVVRIMNGRPIFLDEHLDRLQYSLDLIYGNSQYSRTTLENEILKLIHSNEIEEGNLKIEIQKTKEGFSHLLYFIPHRYPTKEQIENGIRMRFQFDERPNPNAKVSNWQVRGNANSIIDKHQIYETLLVNSNGYITEGSRSNIFFIKDKKLYSAPKEWILPGITRLKVLQICEENRIPVFHEKIHYTEIHRFDSAFITGTSPGILQVREIEEINFQLNNPLFIRIRELFTVKL